MTQHLEADAIARNYIACWNETDGERRRALLAQHWAADATYVDPLMQGSGRDAIDQLIAAVQARFPGHSFTLKPGAEGHHDRVRFSWSLGSNQAGSNQAGAGAPIAHGTDFATLGDGARIVSVTGFLDQVTAQP
jgi:hypothetical protein